MRCAVSTRESRRVGRILVASSKTNIFLYVVQARPLRKGPRTASHGGELSTPQEFFLKVGREMKVIVFSRSDQDSS